MATGTTPSAADEALGTTDKKANFQRLTRLLMRGGLTLLREVFDAIHPPANLPAVLGNPVIKSKLHKLKGKKVLTQPEYDCLYSPPSGAHGKSTDFDISLLCKLLRAICSLTPPISGWDNSPNSTDHSLEADLVRIRIYRNSIYGHNHSMEITDADFGKLWTEISEALLRIAGGISSAKKDEWKKAIENFFHDPLTPDAKECIDELRLWYLMDMDTKEKLEKLSVKVEQGHQNLGGMMERMQIKQEQLEEKLMDIHIVVKHLQTSGSFVNGSGKLHIATQVEGAQLSTENVETRIPIPTDHPPSEGTACPSKTTELQASEQTLPAVLDFWYVVYSFKRPLELLIKYLKIKLGVNVQSYALGSLIITVSCSSLEILEGFWNEYRTGRLDEVVQDTLVTAEVLEKLELSEVKLRTIISEEDYLSYKDFLKNRSGNDKISLSGS